MFAYPNFQTRPAGAHATLSNTCCAFTRFSRPNAARFSLYAVSPLSTSTARDRPSRLLRPCAAAGVNASGDLSVEDINDEDQRDDADDEEFIPPPLPTSALELLSEVLTGIAASSNTVNNIMPYAGVANNAASSSLSSPPPLSQGGSSTGVAYRPLRFCVNCCRPLLPSGDPSRACTGCGHDSHRDAEVLGHPTAWVEAYAAQLRQQQEQQQGQQQDQAATAAESKTAADSPRPSSRDLSSEARRVASGVASGGGGEVLLAADERTLLHRSSLPPYPGRPERLRAIMSHLHSRGLLQRCRLLSCRPATDPELLSVHSPELVAAVRGMGAPPPPPPPPPLSGGGGATAAAAASDNHLHPQQNHHYQDNYNNSGSFNGTSNSSNSSSSSNNIGTLGPATDSNSCSCGGGNSSNSSSISSSAALSASSPSAALSHPQHPQHSQQQQQQQCRSLCADTLYNAHTCTAALLAAGAAADIGSALARGEVRAAMAVMRPPGAQAGYDVARGGCYLNNVAVAAAAALSAGLQRVMIVDWDVHHGRGTEEIFASDPRVMVVSMHRYDSETYPGSGAVEDVGEGAAEGTTLNVAFGRGSQGAGGLVDGDLLSAVLHVVLPVAYQFRPQLVLVAAGFGALKGDPIGGCSCTPAVFAHLTHLLSGVSPRGALGLLLEGGYNLAATSEAVEGCVRVLLGEAPPPLPGPWGTTREGWVAIMNAMQIHSHFWSSLHPLSFHGWTSAIAQQQQQLQLQQEQQLQQEDEEEEEDLQRQEQEEEEEAEKRLSTQFLSGLQSAAAAGGSGVGGWALRDDDRDADDEVLDDEDDGGGDGGGGGGIAGGLSAEDLARVAAAFQRARAGWDVARGRADEDVDEQAAAGMAGVTKAAHLSGGPRDIEPAELLDLFLGTGISGTEEEGERGDGGGGGGGAAVKTGGSGGVGKGMGAS